MAKRKKTAVPILRIRQGDNAKTINAKARRALTAADVQKYTETEAGIPARQILEELEAIDRESARQGNGKPRNGRSR